MKTPLGLACVLTLPVLALLVALIIWNPSGNYWESVEPPKAQVEAYDGQRLQTMPALTSEIYDQRKLDRFVREPQNTVSNVPYVTAGLAILLAAGRSAARSLGFAAIFLGLGSGMYHASLLSEWRLIDILGVYAVLYCLLWLGVTANWPRAAKGGWTWVAVILVWAAALYSGVHRNDIRWLGLKLFDSTYVFVAAVALGCGLAALVGRRVVNRRLYAQALVVLTAAATISFSGGIGDRFGGFWSAPDAFIQGHAVWHTFGAIGMLAAYEAFAATGVDQSTLRSGDSA